MVSEIWENILKKHNAQKDISSILRECFLFESLDRREITFLKSMVHERHFLPGEAIFKQDEMAVGVYILVRGKVDIFVRELSGENLEPKDVRITSLEAGDFFGEMALIEENCRRTATAIASEETRLIGFFKPDLTEMAERRPSAGVKIALKLAEVLGKRLRETSVKVNQLKKHVFQLNK